MIFLTCFDYITCALFAKEEPVTDCKEEEKKESFAIIFLICFMIRKFVNILRALCAIFPWISHEIWLGVYLQKLCLMQSSFNSIVFREEWFVSFFMETVFSPNAFGLSLFPRLITLIKNCFCVDFIKTT